MINKKFVNLLIALSVIGAVFHANAQAKSGVFPADATWVKMIDDPNVNYYEAVKTYNNYWKTHPKPADPEKDLKDKDKATGGTTTHLSPEEKRLQDKMVYEIKRFETWMREEKPFVQPDGRILSQEERNAIWKKQQQEKSSR
jgi:hypothetical protein